ncbi:iron-containing alcohol dehydrogenase [Denitrovibrio acetiphilus DSM 12809]|uniref:Iron-containing alcohol dehydrogenase n=1 Tax=Denitrovibrio acetiphilus (strain DSM 12809 / NBRC 114555 / N2460) TaxID=522772 RepID=D4H846_DENA2|nr:iron-containing alcohol dehydrogenase [Denitrovibrio acetiphilus]ADD68195.1 iron-containing alcohol dehydrogenase [Denitrovibrio acetiphilus DSM 12809]
MNNFVFCNPTKIVFGKGQVQQLNSLIPENAKVLITYGGGSIFKNGVMNAVKEELAKSDRKVFEFGGIEPNPKFETLMKAVEIVRKEGIDFLLAVGGGSVMDGTKFIAITAPAKEFYGKEEELLYFGAKGTPVKNVLPLGTVATLPATGSEMNNGGVVTKGTDKMPVFNAGTFPVFSILDPEYTYSLPATQVANGVVDTFVHTVEQYVTYPVDGRFQDRTSEGILQTLIEIGSKTIEDPKDYDSRANLVWCSTMALNGLIGSGVPQDWSVHMIGHEMTALYGIDHAKTLAVVLPAMWRVRKDQKREKLLQYGERIFGITSGSEDERIEAAIVKTEEFFNSLGIKTRLSDYGLKSADIKDILANLEKHKMLALSERGDVDLKVSEQVLKTAL